MPNNVTGRSSRKPKSTASVYFPNSAKIQPKGFKNLEIDQDVKIVINGKIKSISSNQYEDGDGSKDIRVELKSCSILSAGPDGSISMQSDMD
jgi:hypothetical protein